MVVRIVLEEPAGRIDDQTKAPVGDGTREFITYRRSTWKPAARKIVDRHLMCVDAFAREPREVAVGGD